MSQWDHPRIPVKQMGGAREPAKLKISWIVSPFLVRKRKTMVIRAFPRVLALGKIRSEDKTPFPAGQSFLYLKIRAERSSVEATDKKQVSVRRARSPSGLELGERVHLESIYV